MKLNKLILGLAVPGILLAGASQSAAYDTASNIYEARVVSTNPVYRTVQVSTPKQECWEEAIAVQPRHQSRTPEIFGAIVGAGIGRLFGNGRGQDVATVAGAVLGGSIGRDQKHRNSSNHGQVRYEQRCKVVDEYRTEERLHGYDVTYEHDGNLYTTHTQNDPGQTIKISVSVVPVE